MIKNFSIYFYFVIYFYRLTKHSSAESDVGAGSMVYESTEDSLSAMWHYNETESEIVRGWYAVGTYPYADDIAALKEVPITTSLSSFLANNEVRPDTTGLHPQSLERSFKIVDNSYNLFEVIFKKEYLLVYHF